MNSRQRRKANKFYEHIKNWFVVRLRITNSATEEEIEAFKAQKNFLLRRLPVHGSYTKHLSNTARMLGVSDYVKQSTGLKREERKY